MGALVGWFYANYISASSPHLTRSQLVAPVSHIRDFLRSLCCFSFLSAALFFGYLGRLPGPFDTLHHKATRGVLSLRLPFHILRVLQATLRQFRRRRGDRMSHAGKIHEGLLSYDYGLPKLCWLIWMMRQAAGPAHLPTPAK